MKKKSQNSKTKEAIASNNMLAEEKFAVTKDEFMKPYRTKVAMNDMVAKNLKAKGMSEESINDYLQMIDED